MSNPVDTMDSLCLPVTSIKGIGEDTKEALQEIGVGSVQDLLEYFPYRYDDYLVKDLAKAANEEKIMIQGRVHSEPLIKYFSKRKSRLTVRVLVDRYLITAVFFNRPFYKKHLKVGEIVTLTGKWEQHRQQIIVNEMFTGELKKANGIEPVYATKGRLTVKAIRKFMNQALIQFDSSIHETLPPQILNEYKLLPRRIAYKKIHFPHSRQEITQARRRFVYEEFLNFQLRIHAIRLYERKSSEGIVQDFSRNDIDLFIKQLPFQLTTAQHKVVNEILKDMGSSHQMNRLLQGDVGTGKTIVAAICLYASFQAGFQGALMVPTEILAEQHYQSLKQLFGEFKLNIELLTSSVKGKQRKEILSRLAEGDIHIIVGTHALIQSEVSFHSLGLVITDEQHRFGVEQRRVLKEKGQYPDVLFMTATPIPRTLAITVFGDMDVSIIDEMPVGRKSVETYWAKPPMLDRVLTFIKKEIKKGRQAYVICPLIEESDKLDVQNAIDVHSMLTTYFGMDVKVGLMHGRLAADEKEKVMKLFSENMFHILVSTTVVEVGVNVPNATVMVIYDAERFGLSQLHQLRGRVGRGHEQSYCILLADPKSETGKERMKIMTQTNNGFELSEKDLELRGPGDFFGKKQSGIPEFKLADIVHDYRALETARKDAEKMINSKFFWEDDSYFYLRKALKKSGALSGNKLD